MREISRETAIKIVWATSKQLGISSNELRSMCPGGSISRLTGKQMSELLGNLGKSYFVREPGWIKEVRGKARFTGIDVQKFIIKRFGKDNLYKLDQRERRGVLGMLRNYCKK